MKGRVNREKRCDGDVNASPLDGRMKEQPQRKRERRASCSQNRLDAPGNLRLQPRGPEAGARTLVDPGKAKKQTAHAPNQKKPKHPRGGMGGTLRCLQKKDSPHQEYIKKLTAL